MMNLYDLLAVIPESQPKEIALKYSGQLPVDIYTDYQDIEIPLHQLEVYNVFTTEFDDIIYISCLIHEDDSDKDYDKIWVNIGGY